MSCIPPFVVTWWLDHSGWIVLYHFKPSTDHKINAKLDTKCKILEDSQAHQFPIQEQDLAPSLLLRPQCDFHGWVNQWGVSSCLPQPPSTSRAAATTLLLYLCPHITTGEVFKVTMCVFSFSMGTQLQGHLKHLLCHFSHVSVRQLVDLASLSW